MRSHLVTDPHSSAPTLQGVRLLPAPAIKRLLFDLHDTACVQRDPATGAVLSVVTLMGRRERECLLDHALSLSNATLRSSNPLRLHLPVHPGDVSDRPTLAASEPSTPVIVEFVLCAGKAGSSAHRHGSVHITLDPAASEGTCALGITVDAEINVFGISLGSQRLCTANLSYLRPIHYFQGTLGSHIRWCRSSHFMPLRLLDELAAMLAKSFDLMGHPIPIDSVLAAAQVLEVLAGQRCPELIPD